jgi:hypothetical protein
MIRSVVSSKALLLVRRTFNFHNYTCDALPAPGNPFHLALPVHNMALARDFYGSMLGLVEGRRADDKVTHVTESPFGNLE